jgi:hypothetical protein
MSTIATSSASPRADCDSALSISRCRA